ncbi:MAG TPA: cobalt ECF transporter T component CbiQ [Candidatus Limnocylindria bacterium]|nr:cobalt ECF transporter T component CbiQ [Candidatus Limnocylindria bacterium]
MGAGHASRLYVSTDSPVHRLPPQTKLAALLAFVLIVVSTPRGAYWAFAAYGLMLLGVALTARVPVPLVLRRMTVEIPFVLFALLIPFVAQGPQTTVLGFSVSVSGLQAMVAILAKSTLGIFASVLLASTTEMRGILQGLERLRLPPLMVQIMGFMVRYMDVIGGERDRMRIARESRGFVARDVRQMRIVAASAGALFIRSYERGERVHLAMLSRGYTGTLPQVAVAEASPGQWATAAMLPLGALVVVLAAWMGTR